VLAGECAYCFLPLGNLTWWIRLDQPAPDEVAAARGRERSEQLRQRGRAEDIQVLRGSRRGRSGGSRQDGQLRPASLEAYQPEVIRPGKPLLPFAQTTFAPVQCNECDEHSERDGRCDPEGRAVALHAEHGKDECNADRRDARSGKALGAPCMGGCRCLEGSLSRGVRVERVHSCRFRWLWRPVRSPRNPPPAWMTRAIPAGTETAS